MPRPRRNILLTASCLAAGALLIGGCAAADDSAGPGPVDLRGAPWILQPVGSPSIDSVRTWPSASFGPRVSYGQALEAVLASAATGEPIRGAQLADPLPPEVVYVAPESLDAGIRLSLTAPFGFDLERRAIRPASVSLPGDLSPDEAAARVERARAEGRLLPDGATVDVPVLDPCQIARGQPTNRPACP
jgi:hypothetical protein